MKRNIFLIVMLVLYCTTFYAADVWDGTSAESWTKGTGTESDPYLIETAAQWAYLKVQVAAGNTYTGVFFLQTQDIDLNSKSCPVGSSTYPFSGVYDGGNHEIQNASSTTLFSYIKNSTIKNLTLSGASTNSMVSVSQMNCQLINCHNNSTKTVTYSYSKSVSEKTYYYCAGLIAYADTISMKECSNRASISSRYQYTYVGGLVGYATSATLYKCINYGDVNCTYSTSSSDNGSSPHGYCSGLIASYSSATVACCGNEGNVTGGELCYGIRGTKVMESYNKGIITPGRYGYGIYGTELTNCYVLGGSYSPKTYVYSFVFDSPNLRNCYYAANNATQVCISSGHNVYSNIYSYERYQTSYSIGYQNLNNIFITDTLMKSPSFPALLNEEGDYFYPDYTHINNGYPILKWQLGDTDFYTVKTLCQESQGTVTGTGEYPNGAQIQLTATPKDHYTFTQWSDGVTDNPRTVSVTADAMYVAQFERSSYTVYINQDCSIVVE